MKITKTNNQKGLVSIIVTLIIMIVLTLIVTGFAQLARNEQREATDRQLNSQALFAAQSGINAAEAKVKAEIAAGNYGNYSDCSSFSTSGIGTNNAEPTCILVNKTPETLVVQNVLTNKSTILPIEQGGGGTLDDLTISWENQSHNNVVRYSALPLTNVFLRANGGTSPDSAHWGDNGVGVLRIDLVPVDSLDSNTLREGMFTAFLVPTTSNVAGVGVVDYSVGSSTNKQGVVVGAKCSGPPASKKLCAVQITGLNGPGRTKYYLRMKSIYNPSDVVICPSNAFNCTNGQTLVKAQTVIDVTARAADVLKRVQVRVNSDPNAAASYSFPEYTLDSAESICKLLTVTPTSTTDDSTDVTKCPA